MVLDLIPKDQEETYCTAYAQKNQNNPKVFVISATNENLHNAKYFVIRAYNGEYLEKVKNIDNLNKDNAVGVIYMSIPNNHFASVLEILLVDKTARRQGIGRSLIDVFEHFVKIYFNKNIVIGNYCQLDKTDIEGHLDAKKFYNNLGYAISDDHSISKKLDLKDNHFEEKYKLLFNHTCSNSTEIG